MISTFVKGLYKDVIHVFPNNYFVFKDKKEFDLALLLFNKYDFDKRYWKIYPITSDLLPKTQQETAISAFRVLGTIICNETNPERYEPRLRAWIKSNSYSIENLVD